MLVSHNVKARNETFIVGGCVAVTESRQVSTVLAVALILSTTVTTQRSHISKTKLITPQAYSSAPVEYNTIPRLVPFQL